MNKNQITKSGVNYQAYRFFFENAGYCVGRRAAGALALARAEKAASERGWSFSWEWDELPYEMGDAETEPPEEVLVCVLKDEHGRTLECLGGIGDPSKEYVRVVEAELALEAGAVYRYECTEPAIRGSSVAPELSMASCQ